jgi:hypothetical protein
MKLIKIVEKQFKIIKWRMARQEDTQLQLIIWNQRIEQLMFFKLKQWVNWLKLVSNYKWMKCSKRVQWIYKVHHYHIPFWIKKVNLTKWRLICQVKIWIKTQTIKVKFWIKIWMNRYRHQLYRLSTILKYMLRLKS